MSTSNIPCLKADDARRWSFYAEGGGHLLLQRINDEEFVDRRLSILRIPKYHKSFGKDPIDQLNFGHRNQLFIDENFKCWFPSSMISSSIIAALEKGFIEAIISNTEESRPAGRRKKPLKLALFGYLERNLFEIGQRSGDIFTFNPAESLSFELKVKSSLRSISPFLEPPTNIKLFYDRYYLTQYYKDFQAHHKSTGSSEFGWGRFERKSSYVPSDLCSDSIDRVQTALTRLMENPQNNLGVFHNGLRCYGWSNSDYASLLTAFELFFHPGSTLSTDEEESSSPPSSSCFSSSSSSNMEKFIRLLMSLIIKEESALQSLELMQYLDWIDSEGSAICYSQFTRFGLTEEQFQQYLKEYFTIPLENNLLELAQYLKELHGVLLDRASLPSPGMLQRGKELLSHSPILLELHEVTVETVFQMQASCLESKDVLTENFRRTISDIRERACSIIARASLEEIAFVLKLWMLSAVSKDCSVIISLIKPPGQHNSQRWKEEVLPTILIESDVLFIQKQSESENGRIIWNRSGEMILEYQMTFIDIGMKDFAKFTTRSQKDVEICEVFLNSSSFE